MAPKIDGKKRSAILNLISILWGRQTADILELRDGKFYLHVLSLLETKDAPHPANEAEWLFSIQKFLLGYYGASNPVDQFIKFDAILKSEMPALVELELAKIAVVLFGIGILDKNSKYFLDAAMKVPEEMHQDIVDLFQSVVQAGSTELVLTDNIEKVLIVPENSAFSPPIMCQQKASTPKDRRHTTTASFLFKDSPLRTNTSLNCSLQDLSSPLDTTSSSSLLMQFVQSPQLIQKASLNQKELEIRKLKQQLNDEIYMKDELKFTIQDHISQCAMKDTEIAKLQSRIKELVVFQEAKDDFEELKLRYREMEDELFKYKNKVLKLQDFEDQAKHKEKEINEQCKELDKLRHEVKMSHHKLNLIKKNNNDQQLLQQTISQLQDQIESLKRQLEGMHNVKQQWDCDKEVMLSNFQMVKEVNKTLRQELDELHGTRNDTEAGENMSVFVDIQLRELREELKEVKEKLDALFNLLQMDSLKDEFDKSKIDFEQQLKEKSSVHEKESEDFQIKLDKIMAESEERIAKITSQLETYQSREEENNLELNTWKEKSNTLMKELENVQLQAQHAVTEYKKQISDMACKLEAYQSKEKENNSIVAILKEKSSNQEKELEVLRIKHELIIAEIEEQNTKLTVQLEACQSREEENNSELKTWKEKSSVHEKESEDFQIKLDKIMAESEERIAKITSQLEAYQSREEENNLELNTWKEKSNTLMKELENVQLQAQHAVTEYKKQISDMACKLEAYQSKEKENNSIVAILKEKSSNQEKELEVLRIKHELIIAEIEEQNTKLTVQLEACQSREEENNSELKTWKEKSSVHEKESEDFQIKLDKIMAESEERIAKITSQLEAYQSREEENNLELNTWKEKSNTLMKELENVQLQAQHAVTEYKKQISDMACKLEAYQSKEKENNSIVAILKEKSSNQEKELEVLRIKHELIIAEIEEQNTKLTVQLEACQSREEENNSELKTWKEKSNSLMEELENVQLQAQHTVTEYKKQISDMACKLEAYQTREKENNSILAILKQKSSNQEKELEVLQIKHEQITAEFEERIAKFTSQLETYQSKEEENNKELKTWKEKSSIYEKKSEDLENKHEQIKAEFEEQIAKLTSQLEAYQSREEENISELHNWQLLVSFWQTRFDQRIQGHRRLKQYLNHVATHLEE